MSMSKPKVKTPARRPERTEVVEPEDIQLGSEDPIEVADKTKGKRSLVKPTGGASVTGVNV